MAEASNLAYKNRTIAEPPRTKSIDAIHSNYPSQSSTENAPGRRTCNDRCVFVGFQRGCETLIGQHTKGSHSRIARASDDTHFFGDGSRATLRDRDVLSRLLHICCKVSDQYSRSLCAAIEPRPRNRTIASRCHRKRSQGEPLLQIDFGSPPEQHASTRDLRSLWFWWCCLRRKSSGGALLFPFQKSDVRRRGLVSRFEKSHTPGMRLRSALRILVWAGHLRVRCPCKMWYDEVRTALFPGHFASVGLPACRKARMSATGFI